MLRNGCVFKSLEFYRYKIVFDFRVGALKLWNLISSFDISENFFEEVLPTRSNENSIIVIEFPNEY